MEKYNIYNDISKRTDGDIYIGVVGPVRTGKSTFIKNFMELLVIPNIENETRRERTIDELPQSAAGRTIMTTEPKFIPNEAVEVNVGDNVRFKTRLVDCVGYLVDDAIGYMEGDIPRMVRTPWFDEEIPFEKAAEIGTRKVIEEHSTIGFLVTTDGSFTGIDRNDYLSAEERCVNELKELNKPFVIILNTTRPNDDDTILLASNMEEKYNSPVVICDCARIDMYDINTILEKILYEFPVSQIGINLPDWVEQLDMDHWLKKDLMNCIKNNFVNISNLRQIDKIVSNICQNVNISDAVINEINLDVGNVKININVEDSLFTKILSEYSGFDIKEKGDIFSIVYEMSKVKHEYDKVFKAMNDVKEKGYGVVNPGIEELILEEPEIVKQGSRFGVKLKAKAPSIHMIRADIETEVSPIVGSEKQSEDLVNYLLAEFESDPIKIWESNIFGKSLHELVNEGLQNKLAKMPEDAQMKIKDTLQKIINEGSGGLICIIL